MVGSPAPAWAPAGAIVTAPSGSRSCTTHPRTWHQKSATRAGSRASIARAAMRLVIPAACHPIASARDDWPLPLPGHGQHVHRTADVQRVLAVEGDGALAVR